MLKLAVLLLAAAAAQPATTPATVEGNNDDLDKMICKRFEVTGSLVGTRKECKTKREWERDRANLRAQMGPSVSGCQTANAGVGGASCS